MQILKKFKFAVSYVLIYLYKGIPVASALCMGMIISRVINHGLVTVERLEIKKVLLAPALKVELYVFFAIFYYFISHV